MPQSDAERMRKKALARWEGEGGALAAGAASAADALDDEELRILARIGYAALGEWAKLPAASKEAMVGEVCRPLAPGDRARARTRIADFLQSYGDR
jgi:hypothetical protein